MFDRKKFKRWNIGPGIRNQGAKLHLFGSSIFTNSSDGSGGGIVSDSSTVTMTNCSIMGNSAEAFGGGIANFKSNLIATNYTLANNSALALDGGAIHNGSESSSILKNCISWNNSAEKSDPEFNGSGFDVQYSCIKGGYPGIGNIDQDPMFIDPDGADDILATNDDNFLLRPGSPAIDAANNDVDIDPNTGGIQSLPDTDLAKKPRFIDDPDVLDIGHGTLHPSLIWEPTNLSRKPILLGIGNWMRTAGRARKVK